MLVETISLCFLASTASLHISRTMASLLYIFILITELYHSFWPVPAFPDSFPCALTLKTF